MAVDTSGADVALGQLTNIPFGQLVAAPLKAAIEAQAIAADTTINFIKEIGFTEDANGALEATTVAFSYQAPSGEKSILTVPILAIVPIPYIEIETLDIDFKAKITASGSSSESQTTTKTGSFGGSGSGSFSKSGVIGKIGKAFKANIAISGGVSSKKDSTSTRDSKYSVEYCYDLHVHATQPGPPAGLSKIISILESTLTPVPAGQLRLSVPPGSLSLTAPTSSTQPTPQQVTVSVVHADGAAASGINIEASSSDDTVLTVGAGTTTPGKTATQVTNNVGSAVFNLAGPKAGTANVTFRVVDGPLPAPAPQSLLVGVA
jgi:Protein of unknown function (DUF2589)